MINIELPVSEEKIRELKTGDFVQLNGLMYTGRDNAHHYLMEEDRAEWHDRLKDRIIYHCGPVVRQVDGEYQFISAGPTTSAREEVYQADVFERYQVRGVIGKGGMFERTLEACKRLGCVYLHAIGGAGALIASSVKKVHNVYMLEEFGVPEAFWEIEVENFPVIVTMDSHGNSLHSEIKERSQQEFLRLIGKQ